MKKILLILLVATLSFTQNFVQAQCNAPIINTFAPNTGFIGSTVTITGAFFDPTPANNQVFFGSTQATVLTAAFGKLTVTVPVGATYGPISVKNGCGLIAATSYPFNGIFCVTSINTGTYNTLSYSKEVSGGYQMLSQDMDLDGKPDMLVCGFTSNKVSVMLNQSTPGNFSFANKFDLNFAGATRCIAPADYDGDGKIDLAVVDNGINGIRIYRNTSVPGTLSFSGPVDVPNIGGYQCAAGDLNNDGKVDLAVGSGNDVVTLRNTSTPGSISFSQNTTVSIGGFVTGLVVTDVDGDGIKDIGAANGGANTLHAVRSTTTGGSTTFSFGSLETFPTGSYPYRLFIGDFDKDGKIDFADNDFSGASVSVFRNTSTPGTISFDSRVILASPSSNYRLGVGDADGDGRPDIVSKSSGENLFSVYVNTSTGPGNISFANRVDYPDPAEVSGIVIADLDGDYVPDISTSGISYNQLKIFRNGSSVTDNTAPTAICKNITVALSPSGNVTVTADMIDNGSSDACGIGSILINNGASVNYTCANIGANTVTLTVIDRAGNSTSCTATVTVAAAAIIASGQTTVCQGQTVVLNANQGDSYQWYKDGVVLAGATNQTYNAAVSGSYTVTVTNAGGCSGTSSATDVVISAVNAATTTLSSSADICQGNTVTITGSAGSAYFWSNGATTPSITTGTAGSYSVTVFDANGCSSVTAPVVVTIKSAPLPDATVTASGTTTFCSGGNVVLTVPASQSYAWSNGATTQSITVSEPGSYFVNVTNADGCFSKSANTAVTVKPSPSVNAGNDVTLCTTPTNLVAIGNSNGAPNTPQITKLCLFSAAGNNCSLTDNLCNDNYQFLNTGTFTESTSIGNLTGIDFKLYYTCSSPTFTFMINGNTIGTYSDPGTACTCDAINYGTYPRTISFDYSQIQAFWVAGASNSITVSINSPGGTATAGIQAELLSPGETYAWSPAAGLSDAGIANPTAFPTETTNYTVTYTSSNGCVATDTVKVTVQCNQAPVAVCKALTLSAGANCNASAAAVAFDGGSTDADAGDVLTYSVFPAGPYAIGVTNVTFTVTDSKGATSSCSTTVTVVDATKPVLINVPSAATVECDAVPAAAVVTATDNCDASPVVTYTEVRTNGISPNDYTLTRTWTATDASGNVSSASQVITVKDTKAPVLVNVPSAATVECDAVPAAAVVTATDNCDASPVVTYTEVRTNGISQNDYVLTRTWTVTDASGNVSSASQVITVKDTKAPVLVGVPSNVTVACDAVPAGAVVTATDNCDASPVVTFTEVRTNGISPNDYVLTRTWTVTDASGNASSGSQVVTVKDTKAPLLTTPSNVSVSNATGICGAPVSYVAIATDNCSPVAITYSVASGFVFPVGSTSVTVTATDLSGNSTSGSFTVTVIDTEAPKAICKPVTVTLVNGAASITAADINNGSTDNCGIASVVVSKSTFSCANIGANTVTLTVTDIYNNVSTCTAVVTVVGEIPSCTITSIRSSSVYTGAPATSLFLGYGAQSTTLKVTPAANGAPYTYSWTGTGVNMLSSTTSGSPVFTPTAAGNYTFTVQTTNVYGCTTTCSITICVTDVRVYSYNDKHRKDHDDDHHDGKCDDDDDDDRRGGNNHDGDDDDDDHGDGDNDHHDGDDDRKVYICHVPNGNHGNPQTLSISVYAVASHLRNHPLDKLGSCDQQPCSGYTDRVKPLVYCPKDITVSCTGSILPSATGTATGRDNYSAVTITYSDVTVGNKITRTWKVTDAAGNFSTCKQTITVGVYFSASITSVPTSNTNTGGVSTNLYLGYGAQSTALKVGSLPSSGAPYTYSWTGTSLSNTSSSAPVFTPTVHGVSSFTVTITNKYGCSVTSSISICVTDIRVPGSNGTKVYVCHTPKGKNAVSTTTQVLVSQVSSHLGSSSCGGNGYDRLGSCSQQPCTPPSANATGTNTSSFTKETGSVSEVTEDLKVTVMPNPSSSHFTIKLESRYQTPVELRVLDGRGRVVDARSKMGSNSTIQIGHNYSSGTYYAEMIQGTTRKVVQLIKVK